MQLLFLDVVAEQTFGWSESDPQFDLQMSNVPSPTRRGGEADPFFESADFTADISHKMRVPKHITASGMHN